MKYLSNKNGFLGIDNKVDFKEKVVVVPFGLEKTVSYGGGTKNGPKEIFNSIEYMLNLAKEFSDDYFKQTNCVDLLFSEKFKENIPQKPASIYKHIFHSIDEIKGKKYDAIILLFTDAIGLGWENIESNLPAGQQAPIFIINGRRRIFKFDTQSRRALQLRRFVARAWWLESLFGLFIIFCSVFFWLHDLVFGYTEAS